MTERLNRRALLLAALLLMSVLALTGCNMGSQLYVKDLVDRAQTFHGSDVTVDGTYINRDGLSVLSIGVSLLDNGLDARPIGDTIWLEGVPETTIHNVLHQPGDSVYGFVRVTGRFESGGGFGPDNQFQHRIQVASVEPIEEVRREELRMPNEALGDGQVALTQLLDNPAQYSNQSVTTRGFYFWNGQIFVLSEAMSYEEDGSSPLPAGRQIWMEGFPPDQTETLNIGPNNSYVWGYVEVTGDFVSGGSFGRNGAYTEFLQVTDAQALEQLN